MKKITDEILNDYIDNQLDSVSLSELKKDLADDEESLNKMKALKIVDETLRDLEVYEAPANFSEKVMNVITKSAKSIKPKMNYFFTGIISVFGIIIAGVLAAAWMIVAKQEPSSEKLQIVESVKQFVNDNLNTLNKIFSNHQVLFAGGLLAAVLLLSAVVVFDSHKNFKNKLKSITQ
jgi:hypothetical protein